MNSTERRQPPTPGHLLGPGGAEATIPEATGVLADWDVLLLLALILADIRLFEGSPVASFTLYELFAWGYCAPYVVGHALQRRTPFPPAQRRFVIALGCYLAWLLLASAMALVARGHSDVLQQAKNILPALPSVCFLFIRVRQPATVARLANAYVLYCIAALAVALLQARGAGPYFRPTIENNDFKLDYAGNLVDTVILGFSGTPNELAVAILPGLMFAAVKLAGEIRSKRWPNPLTATLCLASAAVFVMAQSRGAVLWFAFGFAFVVGPTRRSRSFLLKLGMAAGLVATLVATSLSSGAADAGAGMDTLVTRVLLWKTSFDAMVDDPYVALLGDGGRFVQLRSWQVAGWEFPDAHNGWIDQALFFGLPALLLYALVWREFFNTADRAASATAASPPSATMLDALRGSVLSFMGLYFFEPTAHSVMPVGQLFLLMACGISLSDKLGELGGSARTRETPL